MNRYLLHQILQVCTILFISSNIISCANPIRVDSTFQIPTPVKIELPGNNNENPIVPMPVDEEANLESFSEPKGPIASQVAKIRTRHVQELSKAEPFVAIIDIDSVLANQNMSGPYSSGDNVVDLFKEKLNEAQRDTNCIAVVVRINTPGGSVTATDILWQELKQFKEKCHKPVIGCIMDLGCGGGYYLACACDMIIAHPTSIIGGIGVILNLYNFQGTLNIAKIENQAIKAVGSPKIDLDYQIGLMGEDNKELLTSIANEFHHRFQEVIQNSRKEVKKNKELYDGRVFTAKQAFENHLIDQIGYMKDALTLAKQMGGCPQAKTVLFHRKGDVARTPYATTPNSPLQNNLFPVSIPGIDRSKLPLFLYMWQPDPGMEKLLGK